MIAHLMSKTGLVDQMVQAMSLLFRKFQPILILVPSVMGVLAIPGGAMLSAPMVNSIAKDLNLTNRRKLAINMVYRHIWYFVFPFTPGLILSAGIMGVEVSDLVRHFFPITIVLGVVGYFTFFRGMDNPPIQASNVPNKRTAIVQILMALLPMLVGIILPFVIDIPFWMALTLGLIILLVYKRERIQLKMLKSGIEWKLALSILGIMIFREFINNLDALQQLSDWIIASGLPVWVVAIVLPGLVGALTGSTSGSIGITFPMLAPLIGGAHPDMGYVVLMYASSFFCYYISPVHFCLILTAEYFGVTLKEAYKELFWPTLAGILTMVVLFLIY
jgi:integral membrane protein (TIGR00529 family)